ncbi:hypothetical protein ABPG74_015779 [Tetrahymena malaccensis]
MASKYLFLYSLTLILLTFQVSCLKYETITKLQDVLGSGDSYPSQLPVPSSKTALQNVKVLFAFSHGVEDQEVYYFYNYLIDRGAKQITLGIDYNDLESDVILSDFYKPSYRIPKQLTKDINKENLNDYDVIYIPGGLPSSSALRNNKSFIQKLKSFYENKLNSEKLVIFMCSGTEVFIQSGIINDYLGQNLTGSPASVNTFQTYLKAHNISLNTFTSIPAINLKTQNKPRVVLARDPNASTQFVTMVSNEHFHLNERLPSSNDFTPLRTKDGYPAGKFYLKGVFEMIPENTNLSSLPIRNQIKNFLSQSRFLRSNNIEEGLQANSQSISLIAVSSGVSQREIDQLFENFNFSQNLSYTICPGWVKQYKNSQIFTFSYPPTQPLKKIICDYSYEEIIQKKISFDNLIIPGGLFSTNAVLRNDDGFLDFLNQTIQQKSKQTLFSSSGLDLLLPLKLKYPNNELVQRIEEVPEDRDVGVDTSIAGLNNKKDKKTITIGQIILSTFN